MDRKLNEAQVLGLLTGETLPEEGFPTAPALLRRLQAVLGPLRYNLGEQQLAALAYYFDDEQRALLQKLAQATSRLDEAAMVAEVGEERYWAEREPRYGEGNPERMDMPFWELMVRQGWSADKARYLFDPAYREYRSRLDEVELPAPDKIPSMQPEELEALNAALPKYKYGGAVWCFSRFGQSRTVLRDGREVLIGGEHEDWYDPDFHIYNDVVVIDRNLDVTIYGYPFEVFRPTDFHTATLVGNSIYVIGCLGYAGTQPIGETPVLRLDLGTFAIEPVATTGDNPGWIFRHEAVYVPERKAIRISGGKVLLRHLGKRRYKQNRKTYWLEVETGRWLVGKENPP